MAQLSAKLRSVDVAGGSAVAFWCPGCDHAHMVAISGPKAWGYNGDAEKPTFTPSWRDEVCHSFVRDGQIQFLGDCTHALKGQTVPLPDWPAGVDGMRRS
jgi:hypothetical protein